MARLYLFIYLNLCQSAFSPDLSHPKPTNWLRSFPSNVLTCTLQNVYYEHELFFNIRFKSFSDLNCQLKHCNVSDTCSNTLLETQSQSLLVSTHWSWAAIMMRLRRLHQQLSVAKELAEQWREEGFILAPGFREPVIKKDTLCGNWPGHAAYKVITAGRHNPLLPARPLFRKLHNFQSSAKLET